MWEEMRRRGRWRPTPVRTAGSRRGLWRKRTGRLPSGIWSRDEAPCVWAAPSAPVRHAGGRFSPLDRELHLGAEGYSPAVLQKIEFAGGNAPSFEQAAETLKQLAEFDISAKHVQRITERLGAERQRERDREVEAFRCRELRPQRKEPPRVVAVHVDAGKAQMREDDGARGVRNPRWADTKVACLNSYSAPSCAKDPSPDPPAAFLDPPAVARLVMEVNRVRSQPAPPTPEPLGPPADPPEEKDHPDRPRVLVRTAVATTGDSERFGYLVAAEAQRRGFYDAPVKGVLGDGGNWIGPLGDTHFPGWHQILDFVHLLGHLYAAAGAAFPGATRRAWGLFEKLLRAAWAGKVGVVLATLEHHQQRLGPAPDAAPDDDPRRLLARVLTYVRANAGRMDYPTYRRLGLPVSSAAVESLIKQFNQRVKGTEKFWTTKRLEAILQVRAAYLSQDDRARAFFDHRPPGRAARAGPLRRAA